MLKLDLIDADLKVTCFITKDSIKECFIPLCNKIEKLYREKNSFPFVIGIGGPPGAGKSTLALIISGFLKNRGLQTTILPLDGFHLRNEVLKEKTTRFGSKKVPLYEIKGARQTYDAHSFILHLKRLKNQEVFYWPIYSRKVHQPVSNGIMISSRKRIFIVEGNYIFLDIAPWNRAREYFNLGIFIVPKPILPFSIQIPSKRTLKKRIIKRKIKGGISKKEARKHYRMADRINIKEVIKGSKGYDLIILQKSRYRYILLQP